jgi:hypothetical protein
LAAEFSDPLDRTRGDDFVILQRLNFAPDLRGELFAIPVVIGGRMECDGHASTRLHEDARGSVPGIRALVAHDRRGERAPRFDRWLEERGRKTIQGWAAEPVASAEDDHKLTPLERTLDHEVDARDVAPPLPIAEERAGEPSDASDDRPPPHLHIHDEDERGHGCEQQGVDQAQVIDDDEAGNGCKTVALDLKTQNPASHGAPAVKPRRPTPRDGGGSGIARQSNEGGIRNGHHQDDSQAAKAQRPTK